MSGGNRMGRIVRRTALHAALLLGSIVFAAPFVWLLSTSAKTSDELYPPRWVPQIPPGVTESPYVMLRANERPRQPVLVSDEDWERLRLPIREAIQEALHEHGATLPPFVLTYLDEPDWADGIFNRLLKRAPEAMFKQDEESVTAWFAERVEPGPAFDVFDTVYRRVALADVSIHGWDLSVERANAALTWTAIEGDASVVDRREPFARPSQELHYTFESGNAMVVQTILPMTMPAANVKKFVVGNRADRTWYAIHGTFEFDRKRYASVDSGFTGTDKWQDITWQIESDDDSSIKMKTWLRLTEEGAATFDEPGQVRVTLRYEHAPRILAMANKYWDNYRRVLRIVPIMMYVWNSVLLVVLNVLGQVIGSSLVAYAFARLRWPGRDAYFVLVLATLMIPPQVTMIPVFLIFKNLGWYNTLMPLWVPAFFGSAFYIFLLRQFMMGIPKDLEDSAKIDGCGFFGIYMRVVLPLIKPALATIGIFTFLAVWNEFMGPLIYLSDQRLYPLSLGLFSLQVMQSNAHAYGLMMAASVLMTLPVVGLFFAAQRYFIQGITLTGLKG
jgi:multiple sugar transport system permease protein